MFKVQIAYINDDLAHSYISQVIEIDWGARSEEWVTYTQSDGTRIRVRKSHVLYEIVEGDK